MMTQQQQRRRRLLACAAGAAAFLMSVALIFTSRSAPCAERIADARGWGSDAARQVNNNDPAPYFWLSDHEILFFRGNDPLQAFRYDTRTQRETPALLAAPPRLSPAKGFPLFVSPDGRWLLWVSTRGTRMTPVASRITGKPAAVFWTQSSYDDTNVAWLPDSSGWVWQIPSGKVTYRLSGAPLSATARDDKHASDQPHLLGPFAALHRYGRAGFNFSPAVVGQADFCFLPLPRTVPLTVNGRDCPLSLPAGAQTRAVLVVSPRGDHAAWLTQSWREAPLVVRWIYRFAPGIWERLTRYESTFWVDDLDGGGPRPIATITSHVGDLTPSPPSWTPDGKRLSFIHNGALWTLPAQ